MEAVRVCKIVCDVLSLPENVSKCKQSSLPYKYCLLLGLRSHRRKNSASCVNCECM